jgi:hypothetical protein
LEKGVTGKKKCHYAENVQSSTIYF